MLKQPISTHKHHFSAQNLHILPKNSNNQNISTQNNKMDYNMIGTMVSYCSSYRRFTAHAEDEGGVFFLFYRYHSSAVQ